jgi:16S rRNA (guanine527-N7)-methyltransferase
MLRVKLAENCFTVKFRVKPRRPLPIQSRTVRLPSLTLAEFSARLEAARGGEALAPGVVERLKAHYDELARWAPRVDLIGPGAVAELFTRHYAESLAALPWLPPGPHRLLDLGSGAGFPGFVVASARLDLDVWLVEPRTRRRAFLAAAARRAALSLHLLDATVADRPLPELPDGIAVVTMRALRLDSVAWRNLSSRLAPGAQLILWAGAELPDLPPTFHSARELRLPASDRRVLREFRFSPEAPR